MAKRPAATAKGFAEILNQDLKTGEFRPVYIIDGEDQLRMDQVVEAIRRQALDAAAAAFNDHVLQADQCGWAGVLQQAQSFPMMGARQVVVARHADQIRTRKDDPDEKALAAYLANPVDTTILVITGEKFDGRKAWLAGAKKAGCYFHFAAPTGRDLAEWIAKAAQRAGLDLDPEGRESLAYLVGNDLQALRVEIDKLALLQESRGSAIPATEIPELVMDQAELDAFKLSDALAPGQAADVLRAWWRLSTWGTDVYQLTPLVMSHLRRAALAAAAAADGVDADQVAASTGLNPWYLKKNIIPLGRRLGPEACRSILRACAACERSQKSRPVPPELAFEQLLFTATGRR
jgi:DNA polymerase-3 subunit delta